MTNYPLHSLIALREGSGAPPILLLHGWGGDAKTFASLAAKLSAQRETIRLALPGFGGSPEPSEPWGTWEYVETVRRWTEFNFPAQKLDIITHSFGGRVAIGIAAKHPDLVGRLVLIGSAGLRPKRPIKVRMKRVWGRILRRLGNLIGGKFEQRIESARAKLGSEDWRNASPVMRGVLSRVLDEDLSCESKQITAPTLLIWGDRDTATPLWMGRAFQLLIPHSELIVLNGAGHYCFLDKPGEVISAVWKHLEMPEVW